MPDQPIELKITVGGATASIVLIGDPADGMFASNVGRAVSIWIMEQAPPRER